MRTCSKCGRELSEEHFNYAVSTEGKRKTVCRDCTKEYDRNYYKENIDRCRERSIQNNGRNKERFIEYKKTLKCQVCGEERYWLLDFHHTDRSNKKSNVSDLATGPLEKAIEEADKCIVVCSNCHRSLHYWESVMKDIIKEKLDKEIQKTFIELHKFSD